MAKRRPIGHQPGLFDAFEDVPPAAPPPLAAAAPGVALAQSSPLPGTYRDALIEQIIRDTKVLSEDEWLWAPSLEFYEDRIVAFRAEVLRLDALRDQPDGLPSQPHP